MASWRPLRSRLWSTASTLLARDTMVVTNAIAFNFLLCLFPLLLVVLAASLQLPGGRRVTTAVLLVLGELGSQRQRQHVPSWPLRRVIQ